MDIHSLHTVCRWESHVSWQAFTRLDGMKEPMHEAHVGESPEGITFRAQPRRRHRRPRNEMGVKDDLCALAVLQSRAPACLSEQGRCVCTHCQRASMFRRVLLKGAAAGRAVCRVQQAHLPPSPQRCRRRDWLALLGGNCCMPCCVLGSSSVLVPLSPVDDCLCASHRAERAAETARCAASYHVMFGGRLDALHMLTRDLCTRKWTEMTRISTVPARKHTAKNQSEWAAKGRGVCNAVRRRRDAARERCLWAVCLALNRGCAGLFVLALTWPFLTAEICCFSIRALLLWHDTRSPRKCMNNECKRAGKHVAIGFQVTTQPPLQACERMQPLCIIAALPGNSGRAVQMCTQCTLRCSSAKCWTYVF